MELRHLRYFVGVARAGSYRRAAELLHVSQPALSRQITDLEEELGAVLLERNSRGVRLTRSGEGFLDEVVAVLSRLEAAALTARSREPGSGPTLRLGLVGFFASAVLDGALAALHQRNPEIEVRLIEMPPKKQIEALDAGAIDLGITANERGRLPRTIGSQLLQRTTIMAVVGAAHPLARLDKVPLGLLARERFVAYRDEKYGDEHTAMITGILRQFGHEVPEISRVESVPAATATIASGRTVSLAPPLADIASHNKVVFRPLEERAAGLKVEIRAIWHRGRLADAARRFMEAMNPQPSPGRQAGRAAGHAPA